MSDRDLILQFLERAGKRARSNKRFNEIAVTLAIALIVPVVFKLLDLVFLFRARTVSGFFIVWAVATIVWTGSRIRGKNPLSQVAANVDRKAGLNDQLKTAYWFIKNPRSSEWVDAQIQRAAQNTGRLRLESIFPRMFPRTSFIAAALLFVLVALNFVPLSLNHNWVYLQAAPPFSLTNEARINLENALKLLDKAKAAENGKLAEQIEEIIKDLEQGNISLDDAIKQLDALKDQLEEGDLESGATTNGIEHMAAVLRQSKAMQAAAQTMAKGDLDAAAAQMRELGDRLQSLSPADLREMSTKLQEASENPRASLQDLAKALDATGAAIQRGDRTAGKAGLDRIARELESIKQRIADQQLRSDAADELGDLVDELQQQNQQEGESSAGQPGKQGNQSKSDQKSSGGEGEKSEAQAGDQGEQGEAGDPGEQGGEQGQAGDNPGGTSENAPNGKGGNSFGGSTKSAPLEGDATTLEVLLKQEALKIEGEAGGLEPDKEKEAAGERERSKLDYRNAPSDLTPAQKDLLNQDRIPWESRQLIKNYFQAVKPKSK